MPDERRPCAGGGLRVRQIPRRSAAFTRRAAVGREEVRKAARGFTRATGQPVVAGASLRFGETYFSRRASGGASASAGVGDGVSRGVFCRRCASYLVGSRPGGHGERTPAESQGGTGAGTARDGAAGGLPGAADQARCARCDVGALARYNEFAVPAIRGE